MTSLDTSGDASFDVPDPYRQTPFDPAECPAARAADWQDDDDWRDNALAAEIVALRTSVDALVEQSKAHAARADRTGRVNVRSITTDTFMLLGIMAIIVLLLDTI